MGSIFLRGTKLWVNYTGVDGLRVQASTGLGPDQREQAEALLKALETKVKQDRPKVLVAPGVPGVYFLLKTGGSPAVKIGVSASSIARRFKELKTASPEPLYLVAWYAGDSIDEAEEHQRWAKLRLQGEWFRYTGALKRYVRAISDAPGVRPEDFE